MIHFGKTLGKIIHQQSVDSPDADGVYTDAFRTEVDGETACDLPQGTFGHAVSEAVGLADKPGSEALMTTLPPPASIRCGTASRSMFTVP